MPLKCAFEMKKWERSPHIYLWVYEILSLICFLSLVSLSIILLHFLCCTILFFLLSYNKASKMERVFNKDSLFTLSYAAEKLSDQIKEANWLTFTTAKPDSRPY